MAAQVQDAENYRCSSAEDSGMAVRVFGLVFGHSFGQTGEVEEDQL